LLSWHPQTANITLRNFLGAPDLSDVIDQWDSVHHAKERAEFVALLQEWSTARSARVTMLSGDSHIAYASELFTAPAGSADRLPAERDPK
jgi:phosphodiesterase/alkaline phosphatase D-like protein